MSEKKRQLIIDEIGYRGYWFVFASTSVFPSTLLPDVPRLPSSISLISPTSRFFAFNHYCLRPFAKEFRYHSKSPGCIISSPTQVIIPSYIHSGSQFLSRIFKSSIRFTTPSILLYSLSVFIVFSPSRYSLY